MARGADEQGFSLVEVLVALAIMMVVSSVAFGSLSSGARHSADSEQKAAAIRLARTLVDAWPDDGALPHADEVDGFRWRLQAEPYLDPSAGNRSADRRDVAQAPVVITATVEWDSGGKRDSYRLQTVRLGRVQ